VRTERSTPPGPVDAPGPGPASRTVGVAVTVAVVVVTVLLAAVLVEAQRPGDRLPSDPIGSTAPRFELPTLDGDLLDLETLRGRPVVLAFWASWCTTCKADVPKLQRAVADWGPQGVAVVGVVIDDALSVARLAAEDGEHRYPSVFDAEGTARDAYGVRGTPETFLIAADGRVTARWVGPLPAHELDLQLVALTGAG
jgi:cytochrome c biogenesis protein CcmG, thiol:disulfide interchange protein DsbE